MATLERDLVSEKLRLSDAHLSTIRPAINVDVDNFVHRAEHSHQQLLQRWGGPRFHSDVINVEDIDERKISKIIYDTFRIDDYWNTRGFKLTHGGGWDEANGDYDRGFPYPDRYSPLFYSRTWKREHGSRFAVRANNDINDYSRLPRIREGQSVPRAVLGHLRKLLAEHPLPRERDLYISTWERVFEKLGDLWAASKDMRVTVSCAPSDFAWLGDIEIAGGTGSCYRTKGEYEHAKYNIGATKNSFVMFFYRMGEKNDMENPAVRLGVSPEHPTGALPDGRLWGVLGENGVFTTNLYRLSSATVEQLLPTIFKQAFGLESLQKPNENLDWDSFDVDGYAYFNDDGEIWIAPDATQGDVNDLTSEIETAMNEASVSYKRNYRCRCGEHYNDDNRTTCDRCEGGFCYDCVTYYDCCDQYICRDCAGALECVECHERVCYRCGVAECAKCDGAICRSCRDNDVASCDRCGDVFCSNHTDFPQHCEECYEHLCEMCLCEHLLSEEEREKRTQTQREEKLTESRLRVLREFHQAITQERGYSSSNFALQLPHHGPNCDQCHNVLRNNLDLFYRAAGHGPDGEPLQTVRATNGTLEWTRTPNTWGTVLLNYVPENQYVYITDVVVADLALDPENT